MLTGGTSKADIRDINSRLIAMASSKFDGREIKLCYVTVSLRCRLEWLSFNVWHISLKK
jgi:hypothetical protein